MMTAMPEPSPVLHPDAARAIRDAVVEASGNEVFFVGRPGAGHAVAEVQVVARGHERAVPAIVRDVRPGEVLIHNHPSGVLQPSDADLDIAARWGAMGVGFVIVDNEATSAYTVVEPHRETKTKRLGADPIDAVFTFGGVLEKALPGYEHREEQLALARLVGKGFDDAGLVLTEAGTGTGKSLAYLVPAILFAVKNRERVVISTNTINLQEQLIGKDLPFLAKHLGVEFKSVLLKGRSNYLCRRKTDFAVTERDSLFDETGTPTIACGSGRRTSAAASSSRRAARPPRPT